MKLYLRKRRKNEEEKKAETFILKLCLYCIFAEKYLRTL